MEKAIGYIRVSSEAGCKGFSLQDQDKAIQEYCKSNGYELLKVHSDPGKSGADVVNRCGLKKLLMDAEAGLFSKVIVKRMDRLSRDLYQMLWIEKELKKCNVDIISIEQDISGVPPEFATAFKQIVGVFAELEKNMLVRKMEAGRMRKFKETGGLVIGNISYGYKTVGPRGNRKLAENPDEQIILKRMKLLKKRGWSYHKITKALNGEIDVNGEDYSAPSRPWNGKETKWAPQKVYNALHSNHSKGKVSYKGNTKKLP